MKDNLPFQAACAANGNFNATLLMGMLASPTGPDPTPSSYLTQTEICVYSLCKKVQRNTQGTPTPHHNVARDSFARVQPYLHIASLLRPLPQPDRVVIYCDKPHTPPRPHRTFQTTLHELITIMTRARQTTSIGLLVSSVRFSAGAKQSGGQVLC